MTKPIKLGDTQYNVLWFLEETGGWQLGCGWIWDTPSGTVKIMESLVKKGLAKKTKIPPKYEGDERYKYRITPQGKRRLNT